MHRFISIFIGIKLLECYRESHQKVKFLAYITEFLIISSPFLSRAMRLIDNVGMTLSGRTQDHPIFEIRVHLGN